MRSWSYVIIITIVLSIIVFGFLGYYYFQPGKRLEKIGRSPCLAEREIVEYKIKENQDKSGMAMIIIKDKNTQNEKFNFLIEDINPKHYHPLEIHRCGAYVIKNINWEPQKTLQPIGFRKELWRYNYDKTYTKLLTLSEVGPHGDYNIPFYSDDFRIDKNEDFIVFEKIYLEDDYPNYALVIKNLKTSKDVFTLPLKDITKKYPFLEGNLNLINWSDNGRYFWGRTHIRANTLGFFRIDSTNWKYEILPAPKGTMGGDALNTELGYVTYDDGPPWTGDLDFAKMYQEEWKKKGKIVSFYLYNLFTKEQRILATTTDTMWSFQPKWISDTELEYELPTGEKKIYKINEK